MKFFKLFEPLEIGNMTISNRIVMPAINLNMANDGYITQQLIDFYVERAKGGAGMLIVGGCYVDLYGKGVPMMISIDNDDFLPSLTKLTQVMIFYQA
ncbi:MAG: oxidoreductase [Promethearchaeota archaeon]